jgi:hypothetical protein
MTKKTTSITTPFLIKECAYCQKEFTLPECQKKNYRLLNQSDIPAAEPGIFLIALHKACWTEYKKGIKKAWEQIKNDPIYRWSMGDWTN